VDGLVLSGGGDILPGFYGADPEPLPTERYSHPDRCAFEFALVWRCVKSRFPLLGICLGCQTINAAMGGDLIRHLDDPLGRHRRPDPDRPGTRHRIHAEPQSVIGKLYPSPQTRVHSSHHQAVGRLAPGFTVTARGPDGVVEAIENPAYPWILGVQWHPERTPHSPFSALLARWLREQAEQYARGKRG
jgi:putative glutamine amidotransferase